MQIKPTIYLGMLLSLLSCTGRNSSENIALKTVETANSNTTMTNEILDVSALVGKALPEVEAMLGKADNITEVSPSNTPCKETHCDKGIFQSGKYEIVFINDKADWITINEVSNYDLNEDAIQLLGLPKSSPSFSNPDMVLRWERIKDIKEMSFFNNGSGNIGYIYIKAYTN